MFKNRNQRLKKQRHGICGKKAFLCVFISLALCMGSVKVSAREPKMKMTDDVRSIIEKGKLTVALPAEDLHIFFEEDQDGQMSGVDIDLAQGIADNLGVELALDRSAQTYDEMTQKLKDQEVDLIVATYSLSPERAKYIDFTDPYLTIDMGLMMNKQMLVREDIEQNPLPYLKKNAAKIAAVKGTSHVQLLKELLPLAEVVEAKDYDQAVALAKDGDVAGFFCGELEFLEAYTKEPSLRIYTSVFTFSDINDQFAIGVSEDTPQLLSYLNTYLRTTKLETKQQVEERYIKAGKENGKNKKDTK